MPTDSGSNAAAPAPAGVVTTYGENVHQNIWRGPVEVSAELRAWAEVNGETLSEVVREIVRLGLDQYRALQHMQSKVVTTDLLHKHIALLARGPAPRV